MDNAQKSMDIQHQVRNNATELNDFLRGMKSWQQEMQAKDQQLLDAKRLKKEKQLEKEPSTRKLVSPPPKRASKKVEESSKSKTSQSKDVINPKDNSKNSDRIKAYDYSAWDKFDVDKACNDVDKIEPQQEHNGSETECNNLEYNSLSKNVKHEHLSTEEDKTNQLLISKQQAAAEKDRGNEYFKKGKFPEAIECYTRGILCDPANAVLPANRAMALLKTGETAAAEMDCTLSLSIDPTYVKAYQRRASARVNLKRLAEALKDYQTILNIEPNNKIAKLECEKIENLLSKGSQDVTEGTDSNKSTVQNTESGRLKQSKPSFEDNLKSAFRPEKNVEPDVNVDKINTKKGAAEMLRPGQVLPIEKKPHLRSKTPLRRVPIVEIATNEIISTQDTKTTHQSQDFVIRKSSEKRKTLPLNSTPLDDTQKPKSKNHGDHEAHFTGSTDNKDHSKVSSLDPKGRRIKIEEIESSQTIITVKAPEIQKTPESNETKDTVSKSVGLVKEIEKQSNSAIDKSTHSKTEFIETSPPLSSVGFYSTWNNLANATDTEKIKFLNTMKSKDYPNIFKHSLEPSVFEQILHLLRRVKESGHDSDDIGKHLYGLSRVPRVSALVMFLSSADKSSLQDLVNFALQKSAILKSKHKQSIQNMLK